MIQNKAWRGFKGDQWKQQIDVRDFIGSNFTPYDGDERFLEGPSARTTAVWDKCQALMAEELNRGVLDVDTEKISGITSFGPGYIDRENEIIVGLQTDAPLKRMVNPYGGVRMAAEAAKAYGYTLGTRTEAVFETIRKTHNAAVFDAYSDEIRLFRKVGLLSGLPDAYGRGRIIGDYRRVALYGIDFLIAHKEQDKAGELQGEMTEALIRAREEVSEQIRALTEIKQMALGYGIDLSKPAETAREATQFLYLGYLAAVKESNGAAMSLGRCSTFLDIYFERDLAEGILCEKEAQEIIDQFVIKLRLVRHLRTPEYNDLFAGDPNWITESIGGMAEDGRTMATKSSYRFLQTLINLSSAPEPNITILWSAGLPKNFKKFCARISIETDAIQYENDDLMRPLYGDDYAIACCVSAMKLGKQMQFFGARCNLAKALLYAINGGCDEITGDLVVPGISLLGLTGPLDYQEVKANYCKVLEYVIKHYVAAINIIHYMHDKYAYERSEMALHDTVVERFAAFGVAGLSVATDSLSAIRHARVTASNTGDSSRGFTIEGTYPKFGNDDNCADSIAVEIVHKFIEELKTHQIYRNAAPTLSVLTITSNVVYGLKTGATPDGREAGIAFAPGANPMHGRETSGALASLNSVAKIPYGSICQDGISNTFTIVPEGLGKVESERPDNLVAVLEGYFSQGAHHLNVNVLDRDLLEDAVEHPEKYPNLTIRVSGYAVHFNRLSKEQQREVISRTFHDGFACSGC
jgi:formate C-acetyltransferase